MMPFWNDWREGAVFSWLISGGSRSPEPAEGNAEGGPVSPADKPLKIPARETRNEKKVSLHAANARDESHWSLFQSGQNLSLLFRYFLLVRFVLFTINRG
jgi:hypothetical protein